MHLHCLLFLPYLFLKPFVVCFRLRVALRFTLRCLLDIILRFVLRCVQCFLITRRAATNLSSFASRATSGTCCKEKFFDNHNTENIKLDKIQNVIYLFFAYFLFEMK